MAEESSPHDFKALLRSHIDYYPSGTNFVCFLCSFESTDPCELLNHKKDVHKFIFTDFLHIPLFPRYLQYWRLHPPPIIEISNGQTTIDVTSQEDLEIRNSLHKIRLDQVMAEHELERTQIHHLPCLFCLESFDGTYHDYLQWLFEEHQFNPGRPANLIYIPQLIDLLRSELESNVCIFCSSTFPNQRTLRSHMRKKKHLRIPNDSFFDRFYMVNYLELNGEWSCEDDEEYDGQMEPLEIAAADDADTEINETSCLICDSVYNSPEEVIQHMRKIHLFDMSDVRKAAKNNFYDCVRFVNYARFMRSQGQCFVCGEFVNVSDGGSITGNEYAAHILSHEKKNSRKHKRNFWR
ncbi:hypothetical protein TRFO_40117 [Tritrichomonas foetus]|uniref:C2H2-type domain-containing protein n=1 Tax=Tritrichomonas foetus TaxID=1144522 RepID=A0A1J4J4G9_9EUKA|nr:hypothetical protein TRFO_40117 [Tritrichomonas foetus]|eukprot:OHS93609.1 hypothetical protein TRFO_40117 [Tritrichomonas foetus]